MTFLAPEWLLALSTLPIIVVLYLIRSRYRRVQVPSLLLWHGVPRDLMANSAWRRPRWELLLVLQLLVALAVGLALGWPSIRTPPARSLVIVLDVSSSMRATDVAPTRFEAARREVAALIGSAGPDDWLALVIAGARPGLYAAGHRDALTAAVADVQPEAGAGDMVAALRLATGLAGATPGFRGDVVVVTDGAFVLDRGLPPQGAGVSFRLVGGQSDNLAISQASLRRPIERGGPVPGFASGVNFSAMPITAPLVVFADGVPVDSREITIPPRGRTEVTFQVPNGTREVAIGLPAPDALPADNRVELHAPAYFQRSIVLVSENPSLWGRALDAVPYVTWRSVQPAEYGASQINADALAIFDGFAPPRLPPGALVLVDPPATALARLGAPRPARASNTAPFDQLLRGVDIAPLSTGRSTPLAVPDWASVDIADSDGAPLLLHGFLDGRRVVAMSFEPSASNLPQLAAFPLLVANIIDWLTPNRGEELHAGTGSEADIAPRTDSTTAIAAAPQTEVQLDGALDMWPFLVLLGLALLALEWGVASSSTPGLRRPGWLLLLRVATVGCFALAFVRPAITVPAGTLQVVFALDTSDSISPQARRAAISWLGAAMESRPRDDRVGLVAFAADAHVLRAPAAETPSLVIPATGDGGASDLGLGLRVAAGLARRGPSASGRVILLSDGRPTTGDLESALAEIGDVPVDVVPLTALSNAERIRIDRFEVPTYTRAGETFDATLFIEASRATAAQLQVSVDGAQTRDDVIQLSAGTNRISISQTLDSEGFHRISARVQDPAATPSADVMADEFVVVKPAPRILAIEERHGEGAPVQAALREAGMRVDVRTPDQLPSAAQLEGYASVVLTNVSATSFTLDQQKQLRTYVDSNGHGLVVLGGSTSYGLGSYADSVLEQALPVTSSVPPSREDARMALLLIIDNSQSMSRKSSGVSSIEMAREAAILAARSLDERDQIGVLIFNHQFRWLVEMGTVGKIGRDVIESRIAQLQPEGGTEIFAALSEGATAMLAVQADLRHIVLFTDGQSRAANYDPLLARLRQQKIGVSTIGLGPEADTQLLSSLAKLGEGRYYFTERTAELPRIMGREIAISKRSSQVEGTIRPQLVSSSPILRGIVPNDVPAITGYVATTPRDEAQVVLATEDDRPLLSQWHFGLGRTVSWTSDAGGAWAGAWMSWPHNALLWGQVVRWAAGPPVQRDFQVNVRTIGRQADITLDSVRDGHSGDLEAPTATIIDPAQRSTTVPMRQIAPGRYAASVIGDVPGAYEVSVTSHPDAAAGTPRSVTTGFGLRSNPEAESIGPDEHALRWIASETGGHVLSAPASVFRSEARPPGERSEPLWQLLVLLGLSLFVVDVTLRRLPFSLRSAIARLRRATSR